MSYRQSDIDQAMKVLGESAKRAKDRTPNFVRCAQNLGIDRGTLKLWWDKAHAGPGPGRVGPGGKRTVTAPDLGPPSGGGGVGWADPSAYLDEAADLLGIADQSDRRVRRLADTIAQRNASSSDTARAQLTREVNRFVEENHEGGAPRGAETPEEWKARARQFVQLIVELVLEDDDVRSQVAAALEAR